MVLSSLLVKSSSKVVSVFLLLLMSASWKMFCGGLGGLVVSAAFDFMLGEFNIMNDIVHAEM